LGAFGKKEVAATYNGAFGYSGNSSVKGRQAQQIFDKVGELTGQSAGNFVLMHSQDYYGSVIQIMVKSGRATGQDTKNVHLIANPAYPNFRTVNMTTFSYDTNDCGVCKF
jgi:hypothetical protein